MKTLDCTNGSFQSSLSGGSAARSIIWFFRARALILASGMAWVWEASPRVRFSLFAEVEGAMPFDLDEVVWDYAVLSQSEGKTEVLVAVVRKTAIEALLA